MDYYLGDEMERFREVFSDKLAEINRRVFYFFWAFFAYVFIGFSLETWLNGSGLLWFSGGLALLSYFFLFCFRAEAKRKQLFEDWKAGKYPDRPYDYQDYRPRS
ncbi:MAG: hypothetical protein A3C71_03025 [Candidatus Yanofskybacteria bacterium RIFCSPHIGHO2_02_FULL_43_15c]|uniref:2TM domain-containing protein n=1 Tax=Candidatus Yanofskybacteria bacterium RIFCSPHIGHO2_02_FULL_43_15c TaxID=1802679 RepID=A0A1F8FGM2_9BACT|nr:MAG: hypothetical protein A3C71_03025 [Candidatus Yanofskybacteria bacterium RIFCSPHIGHO2_02_FULL_43_15c]